MRLRLLLVFFLLQAALATAQSVPRDSSTRFFGVPLVFYTPDTRWGLGAAGILTYQGNPLRSSVSFSLTYTQRQQILVWLPYQWYALNGRWRIYGEVGWYRYLYQYFGIGNRSPFNYVELYTAQYPRFRATALRQMGTHQNLGLRYWMEAYRIIKKQKQGDIAEQKIPGANGGLSSSAGPVWQFDNRDNPFFPQRGWLIETAIVGEHRLTGSDFKYLRASMDAARYILIGPNKVLAINVLAVFTHGRVPFFSLPQIGGTRRLRGYPDGKFRDRHLLLAQGELRLPLFWRFRAAVFGGTGAVFGSPGETPRWRPNGGLGLRFEFDRKQHLHLRADYGFGEGNSGFYLTMGEAF